MALSKETADKLQTSLLEEFKGVATFQSTTSLNLDGYKVVVGYNARQTDEQELKAIESRATELAGRKLDRNDLEFKSGAGALTL